MPPGPAPDPNSKRSAQRGVTVLDSPYVNDLPARPEPPPDLAPSTYHAWDVFWRSPLRQQVIESDLPALNRLFDLYDRRERFNEEGMKEPLVGGSRLNQPVLNPLLKEVDVLDHAILALEDRFGMSPLSRLKLQVKIGDASRSLAETSARLGAVPDQIEAPDEPDLRKPAKRVSRAAV